MTDTTTAHTAGPWATDGRAGAWDILAPDDAHIASVWREGAKGAADARLIAAAPDLLAALESLLASDLIEWFPPSPNTGGLGDWTDALKAKGAPVLAARAAIAKAKGA